ncbi:MAG TPA: helix-turn-helix transcriptional regulator [Oligoflexia bacterium]|nr:helix-turn-helix transcriptional regulator [Oligoflexia bacterium]
MGQLRKNLAKKLKSLRGDMTQREFARKIGLSKSTLHRIEMGEQNVGIDAIEQICKKLRCSLTDILTDDDR